MTSLIYTFYCTVEELFSLTLSDNGNWLHQHFCCEAFAAESFMCTDIVSDMMAFWIHLGRVAKCNRYDGIDWYLRVRILASFEENKLAKARKMRKPPGTLGLKKFEPGKIWVENVSTQNTCILAFLHTFVLISGNSTKTQF